MSERTLFDQAAEIIDLDEGYGSGDASPWALVLGYNLAVGCALVAAHRRGFDEYGTKVEGYDLTCPDDSTEVSR